MPNYRTTANLDWSIDGAVTEMMDFGAFGPGSEVISFELDERYTAQAQLASTVYFISVSVQDRDRNRYSHQLVVKLKPRNVNDRDVIMSDEQFHNEILFYERIMPFFQTYAPTDHMPSLARYFYGRNNCGDLVLKDMVVLENESPLGYRLSEQRLYLDREHMIVALKTLAKFHGLSYKAKHKDPVKFTDIKAGIKETHLHNGCDWFLCGGGHTIEKLFSVVLERLIQCRGFGDNDRRLQHFRMKFLNDINRTFLRLTGSQEPLAIVCHGDFNRNNLLFRYDDTGRPVDALAFDFATVRYGSPALDLSFFLYMNTDRRLRDEHWDELLDTYCATLAAAVSDGIDVVQVPDRSQIDAEMREFGVYGLVHVSFFIRVVMEEHYRNSWVIGLNGDETAEKFLSFGGDKATDLIADAFQHFLDTYCS